MTRTQTPKPDAITLLLDARDDLAASGDLTTGLVEPDQADFADDAAYEAAVDAYEAEQDRRVEVFAGAWRASAEKIAAEQGIDIEVLDYHSYPDRLTRHPLYVDDMEADGGVETWEDMLWQEIHDVTPSLDPRTHLRLATAERRDTVAYTERLWREAIARALREGVGPTEVARLAEISRERVYQIKDGRR